MAKVVFRISKKSGKCRILASRAIRAVLKSHLVILALACKADSPFKNRINGVELAG